MPDRQDRELWVEVGSGDAEAFGVIFDRYADFVYNLSFRRTGSWDAAEDVVAAVFLEAWRQRDRIVLQEGSLRPWLVGVTLNLARRYWRLSTAVENCAVCAGVVSKDGCNTSAMLEVMLSSSRRVKKGPGRRPQSAKRRRFMELRERGLSIDAAAREVGVSRTAGRNWANGYKTYRAGEVVGFVPAFDRLEVREISARFLSQDERIEIADLARTGMGVREIARRVRRAPSTVSRELRRNATPGLGYRPFEAHRRAIARRARHHRRRVDTNVELRQVISELLAQRWSPQQISRHLRNRFVDDPAMWLCPESIYQAVYEPGSTLMRPSPLAPQR